MHLIKGATRNVLLVGKLAIKIPRFFGKNLSRGLKANRTERKVWKSLHSDKLAEIKYADSFGLVVVMERADFIYSNKFPETPKILNRFIRECRKEKLPVEHKYSNIGNFGNKLKLIDYGG